MTSKKSFRNSPISKPNMVRKRDAMKFLCLAYYNAKTFEALAPDEFQALVGQCPAYDQKLRDTGRLNISASLGAPRDTKTLRPSKSGVRIVDGPYTETRELVGGFFIIEARDAGEAIDIASNHPAANLGEEVGWAVE